MRVAAVIGAPVVGVGLAKALGVDQLPVLHDADGGAGDAKGGHVLVDKRLEFFGDGGGDRQRLCAAKVGCLLRHHLETRTDDPQLCGALLQARHLYIVEIDIDGAILEPALRLHDPIAIARLVHDRRRLIDARRRGHVERLVHFKGERRVHHLPGVGDRLGNIRALGSQQIDFDRALGISQERVAVLCTCRPTGGNRHRVKARQIRVRARNTCRQRRSGRHRFGGRRQFGGRRRFGGRCRTRRCIRRGAVCDCVGR